MVNITQEEQDTQFIITNFDDINIKNIIKNKDTPFLKICYKIDFLQSRNRTILFIDILWMIKPFINKILEIHSIDIFFQSLIIIGGGSLTIKSNKSTSIAIKRIVDEQYWHLFLRFLYED